MRRLNPFSFHPQAVYQHVFSPCINAQNKLFGNEKKANDHTCTQKFI